MPTMNDLASLDTDIPSDLDPREVKIVLVKAEHLIDNPRHWIKGTMVGFNGHDPKTGEVIYAYCAYGALDKVLGKEYAADGAKRYRILRYAMAYLNRVANRRGVTPTGQAAIVTYNDGAADHEHIVSAFKEATRDVARVVRERSKS